MPTDDKDTRLDSNDTLSPRLAQLHEERQRIWNEMFLVERIEAEKFMPCRRCHQYGCIGDGRDVRAVERDGKLVRTIFYCSVD